ncbi:DUF2262 domain-containing protein [Chamaesiphon polymorphus]|jgi:hypothetical protein|uniref:DUF2262 domain-containing protein n=1 Tax=Chamaesiphon polymorphus CCALA 037 TaxID=2107692 RepID=A0A2T1F4F7_9CYAN|nr:DUF2262 domain-containing protein [Chamaesiphon polymorphus]PSB39881.1 hypothetical protein C7B77_28915 [Chamaesiphon polymorphus CCALA 037]
MNDRDLECPGIGTLRYEKEYDWYKGKLKIQQSDISIQLSTDAENSVASALKRASNFVGEVENYARLAKEYAAECLLQIKNENWIDDEDEEPLTPEQFQQRMTLESISIDADGEVSFYHNDGDLFWGHCILVTMNSENLFIGAETAG